MNGAKTKTNNMKLYTEEQVKQAFFEGINFPKSITPASMGFVNQYVAKKINSLTPIELPSDEEIEILRKQRQENYGTNVGLGFRNGAKWMKNKILNK